MGVGCEVDSFLQKTASFSLLPPPTHHPNHGRSPPQRTTPPPQLLPRPHTHPLTQCDNSTRPARRGHHQLHRIPPSSEWPSPGRIEAGRRGLFRNNQALSRPPIATALPWLINNNRFSLWNEEKVSYIDCVMIIFISQIVFDFDQFRRCRQHNPAIQQPTTGPFRYLRTVSCRVQDHWGIAKTQQSIKREVDYANHIFTCAACDCNNTVVLTHI